MPMRSLSILNVCCCVSNFPYKKLHVHVLSFCSCPGVVEVLMCILNQKSKFCGRSFFSNGNFFHRHYSPFSIILFVCGKEYLSVICHSSCHCVLPADRSAHSVSQQTIPNQFLLDLIGHKPLANVSCQCLCTLIGEKKTGCQIWHLQIFVIVESLPANRRAEQK